MSSNHRVKCSLAVLLLNGLGVFSCGPALVDFQPTEADFSFVAIGDTGERGDLLEQNAAVLRKMFRQDRFQSLIFLGDNFYPTGLNVPREKLQDKINSMLDPFAEVLQGLGRENVFALAGNHDYYAFLAVDFKLPLNLYRVQTAPYGISSRGNERARRLPVWTYVDSLPRAALYGPDTNKIQMIFFDSARPLRTDTTTWQPALARLQQLLDEHKNDAHVKWRLLFVHHPFHSLGPHGGYKHWDEDNETVAYLNPCSKDSNAADYVLNLLDPEDTCAPKYQAYVRAVQTAIAASGVTVQAVIAGHEHVLQLIYRPQENNGSPRLHVGSGAGAKVSRVKAANPAAHEFTWWQRFEREDNVKQKGRSKHGFVRFDLKGDFLELRFFDGKDGSVLPAGDGKSVFVIHCDGSMSLK